MADLIVSTPGTCSGQPRVAGTRITVATLDACRRDGWDLMQTLAQYPSLTAAQVEAAWAYAERHAARKKIRASDMLDDLFRDEAAEARADRDRLRALLAAYGRAVEEEGERWSHGTEAAYLEAASAADTAMEAIRAEAAKWREWG